MTLDLGEARRILQLGDVGLPEGSLKRNCTKKGISTVQVDGVEQLYARMTWTLRLRAKVKRNVLPLSSSDTSPQRSLPPETTPRA